MTKAVPPARLDVILARNAPVAVIFRRGPSAWFRLIKWKTDTDELEPGQSFHGRIYTRRCDLSPDGSLLIYFARKITGRTIANDEYTYAWTAVSKPPYFTALALWPKGDCWHGGGLFESNDKVFLNHKPAVAIPHPAHPSLHLRVTPNPDARGEDDGVWVPRLLRDGWQIIQPMQYDYALNRSTQPAVIEKQREGSLLRVELHNVRYSEVWHCSIVRGNQTVTVGRCTWADFDHRGNIVVAAGGKLFRCEVESGSAVLNEIADLNPLLPEPVEPPDWAKRW